tara:strand:- start:21674 stop:23737 length:2064 start_codon:yes stop_codon:yes gene_type:complete
MKKILLLLSSLFVGLTLNAQIEDFEILDDPDANSFTVDWTYNGSSVNWHLSNAGGAYKVEGSGLAPISEVKSLRLKRANGYIETNDVLLDIGEIVHTVSLLVKHTGGTVTGDPHDFELTVYSTTADQGSSGLITTVTKSTGATADTQVLTFSGLTIPRNSRIRIKNTTTLSKGHVLIDDITLNADALIPVVWQGDDATTPNDWNDADNWNSNTVPDASDKVIIPSGLSNYPTASSAVTVNSVIIKSGATLKAESTFAGAVTYKRALTYDADNAKSWHLVSSPVNGEIMTDMRSNNTFADGTAGNRIGFAPYDNSKADANIRWSYFTTSSTDPLAEGKGYSAKIGAVGDISFTGAINTEDVSIDLTMGGASGNNYNLIGNPFTASINSGAFLTTNTAELEQLEIYVWNDATDNYITKPSELAFKVSPGQGFFVEAKTTNAVIFSESIQSHETDDFQKSSSSEIKLNITDGSLVRFADIYYMEGTTTGFDNGYDGKLFGGVPQSFALYTHLVSDSEGKNYQIQSLPNSNYENMVIPVGVNATAGKEITFTAEATSLPSDMKVFLEDKLANTYTRLDEVNSNYKVTLDEALNGIGRFYLHTAAKSTLNIKDISLESISIYKTNNETLRIVGLSQGKSTVKLFNILGKQMMNTSFISNGVQDISLPKLATGIYLIQLETEKGKLNKKIILE